MKTSSSVRG